MVPHENTLTPDSLTIVRFRQKTVRQAFVVSLIVANTLPYALPANPLDAEIAFGASTLICGITFFFRKRLLIADIPVLVFLAGVVGHMLASPEAAFSQAWLQLIFLGFPLVVTAALFRLEGFRRLNWLAIYGVMLAGFGIQFWLALAEGFPSVDFHSGLFASANWGHRGWSVLMAIVAMLAVQRGTKRHSVRALVAVTAVSVFALSDEKFALGLLAAGGTSLVIFEKTRALEKALTGAWVAGILGLLWFAPGPTLHNPLGRSLQKRFDGLSSEPDRVSLSRTDQLNSAQSPGWKPSSFEQDFNSIGAVLNNGFLLGLAVLIAYGLCLALLSGIIDVRFRTWRSQPLPAIGLMTLLVFSSWVFLEIPALMGCLTALLFLALRGENPAVDPPFGGRELRLSQIVEAWNQR